MSLSGRSIRGAWGKIALVSLGAPLSLLATDGCTQQQVATALRSLGHSGRVSFVCLNAPDSSASPGRPQTDCNGVRYESTSDYGITDGETTKPHLYALVTQTTSGEVAVIDMSTKVEAVLDENPRVPGANFLPIGAQPVDIVSTNDGDATFVGVAEIGRQGIFALPSSAIRTCASCEPKTLSDWPACALPGAPGDMLIFDDPPKNDQIRASCDGNYEPIAETAEDAVNVVDPKLGRPKIVTTIPELGGIAVIDAQSLFDTTKHPPGSWQPCDIERWVPLVADVPVENPPPPGSGGPTCVDRKILPPAAQVEFESHPVSLTRSEDKLYVADSKAPVIHVLEMKTPCEPKETVPLLPSSVENPSRIVTTSAVTVSSTLAASLGKYLYALDDYDGSLMVFDISPSAQGRQPLVREHQEWTPFQSPDRIAFGVPIKDLAFIEHDSPQAIPATGISSEGVRCSPDPNLTVCTSDSTSCDPETLYRTSANFDRGASPTTLRGAFIYTVLSTGQIAVVDVDDYDVACRMPRRPSYLNGCPADLVLPNKDAKDYESSGEASCNVVVSHSLRDANFMRTGDKTGQNQPGLSNFPTLYNDQGALQSTFDPDGVVMRATLPTTTLEQDQFNLAVGSSVWVVDAKTGLVTAGGEVEHALAANLEDPRAQTTSQAFSVTYEGALPGFFAKAAKLTSTTTPATLADSSSRFCDQGVLGQKAFVEILKNEDPNLKDADAEKQALQLADYVQIIASTPAEDDVYWQSDSAKGICSFDQCKATFGPIEIPKTNRDLKILEAYQDHLDVALPEGSVPSANDPSQSVPVASIVSCCFPTLVSFNVRVGHQWAVVGTNSGFIHHVIPTPLESSNVDRAVGACRNSCDPRDSRKNSRVRSVPNGTVLQDGDPRAFINPFFRMAINEAANKNAFDGNPDSAEDNAPKRGTFFQINTQGSFRPLLVNLASTTTEIQPQTIGFVPASGEVVIVDGSLEGIILLNASRLDITRQYY